MLLNTFLHVPGVGKVTERALWASGIRCWDDVSAMPSTSANRSLEKRLRKYVSLSEAALSLKDAAFFSRLCKLGESWRLYDAFSDDCVFLDIETTGLSPVFNTITVVGLYDGRDYQVFVDGQNLHELPDALTKYRMAVTFNGAQFDFRFLQAAFPAIEIPLHIDLRWLTARLGHRGGLKAVEADFGISRPDTVAGIGGFDATVLWSRYMRGDDSALNLLIQYNSQDVVNLKKIMETSYRRMAAITADFVKLRKRAVECKKLPVASNLSPASVSKRTMQLRLVRDLVSKAESLGNGTRIVGIDLTGSERRASGWALLDQDSVTTKLIRSDADLVARTLEVKPDLISIDSPLSFPGGLSDMQTWRKSGLPIYRACELALKRMGISVFWCLLPSMQTLTLRGISLAREFRHAGIPVIESYPGAAQDLMLIPRKGASLDELRHGLHRAGINGDYLERKTAHDEIDAATSALVGLFYMAKEHISLGNEAEDYLIVPGSDQLDYRKLASILTSCGLDPVHPSNSRIVQKCA